MGEAYLPTKEQAVVKLVRRARKTNAERDKTERRMGFATPSDNLPLLLRTAISAIVGGLEDLASGTEEQALACIAEGLAMVQDAELALRGKP